MFSLSLTLPLTKNVVPFFRPSTSFLSLSSNLLRRQRSGTAFGGRQSFFEGGGREEVSRVRYFILSKANNSIALSFLMQFTASGVFAVFDCSAICRFFC